MADICTKVKTTCPNFQDGTCSIVGRHKIDCRTDLYAVDSGKISDAAFKEVQVAYMSQMLAALRQITK